MKRSPAVTALLLLQIILQQTEAADDARKTVTLSEETKELRYIMYEQGTLLAELKTDMTDLQKENADLKTQMAQQVKRTGEAVSECQTLKKQLSAHLAEAAAINTKLATSETEVEKLKKENKAQLDEMAKIKARLSTSETEVKKLKKENKDLKVELPGCRGDLDLEPFKKDIADHTAQLAKVQTRLAAAESAVADVKNTNAAQNNQLKTMKGEVDNLKSKKSGGTKVAFSAALGPPAGLRGPIGSETTLIYRNVMTNVGNAYNPATGIFTAPVRGIYYIRFTGSVYDNNKYNMGVNLYKNGNHLMHLGENSIDGIAKHASSGVTMDLMPGDQVYTRLPINYVLWDDAYFRTSFSGFFLFPM